MEQGVLSSAQSCTADLNPSRRHRDEPHVKDAADVKRADTRSERAADICDCGNQKKQNKRISTSEEEEEGKVASHEDLTSVGEAKCQTN